MNKTEGIKKFTEIVKLIKGKTILWSADGKLIPPPDVDDYCIDDLMIFNHGKLEAYKSVLKMFEDEAEEINKKPCDLCESFRLAWKNMTCRNYCPSCGRKLQEVPNDVQKL